MVRPGGILRVPNAGDWSTNLAEWTQHVHLVGVELFGRRPHLQMEPSALLSGQCAPEGAWPDGLAALSQ